MPPKQEPVAARIERCSHPEPNTGCTLWSGPVQADGYPVLLIGGRNGRKWLVSRWLLGLTRRSDLACHRCDNPNCINERHLYVGTDKTNADDRDRRGRNAFANRDRCAQGHLYDAENTYRHVSSDGRRRRGCRACNRAAQKKLAGGA